MLITQCPRTVTGNEAWGGRTIQEALATQVGLDYPLPNVNMAVDGYATPGHDPTLSPKALPELISSALLWPLGLHGHLGLIEEGEAQPSNETINKARQWRNRQLDQESKFFKTFANDPSVKRWLQHRNELMPQFEDQDLISKLTFIQDSPLTPLGILASIMQRTPHSSEHLFKIHSPIHSRLKLRSPTY